MPDKGDEQYIEKNKDPLIKLSKYINEIRFQ